jgi:dihydrofolate synthase/folylpolyglutamate synthase
MVGLMLKNYQETLDYLYSFVDYETQHRPRAAVNYDLRRVEALLAQLGCPHLKAKTVHIAGTKGKGSTAAMISSVLTAAGYRTGLFVSPHLIDIRERIRVDGKLISKPDLVRLTDTIKPHVEDINAAATWGKLTTFELLTTLGMLYFSEQKTDFNVIEVGLGGRLDATNVVCPEVVVISSISLDHTDVLGESLEKITTEKAGIIKEGVPVVSARQPDEARKVIAETCERKHCVLFEVGRDITPFESRRHASKQTVMVNGRVGSYQFELPLLGSFQQDNAALAVGAIEVLIERGFKINASDIRNGLSRVRWPGRFQLLRHMPLVIADGAHNPASARELSKAVDAEAVARRPRILVIGVSADKDYEGVASELWPVFDIVITTRSKHPRSLPETRLADVFSSHISNIDTVPSVGSAIDKAVRLASEHGFICVSGSLFVVGEALEWAHRSGY